MMNKTHVPGPATGSSRVTPLWVLSALLLAGVSVCLYLTRFHENAMYGDTSVGLANCPESATTNCEAVNTSGYSELAGIPISALGVPTYLLLFGMVLAARRRPRLLSHIFSIGLLTVGYSAYLYYVSTVKIGFLCVWCFRLYVINASIPVLALAAARRNPLRLVADSLDDLRRLAPEARRSAAVFATLLVLTILADLGYRSSLTVAGPPAAAPTEAPPAPVVAPVAPPVAPAPSPTTPPAPVARAAPPRPPRAAPTAPAALRPEAAPTAAHTGASFIVGAPLKEIAGHRGGVEVRPFDLQ